MLDRGPKSANQIKPRVNSNSDFNSEDTLPCFDTLSRIDLATSHQE
jgi:hypothetical protein